MPPLHADEWESFRRLFDDAIRDVAERTEELGRWSAHLARLSEAEVPEDLRIALREAAQAVYFAKEDIVDRLSALGESINRLHREGEL